LNKWGRVADLRVKAYLFTFKAFLPFSLMHIRSMRRVRWQPIVLWEVALAQDFRFLEFKVSSNPKKELLVLMQILKCMRTGISMGNITTRMFDSGNDTLSVSTQKLKELKIYEANNLVQVSFLQPWGKSESEEPIYKRLGYWRILTWRCSFFWIARTWIGKDSFPLSVWSVEN
jgi:hypothetical protein